VLSMSAELWQFRYNIKILRKLRGATTLLSNTDSEYTMNNESKQAINHDPITVVISRRVIKGKESEFEQLSTQMTERASKYPGYLGANLFRPANAEDPEYRIIFKFASHTDLQQWEHSSERSELLEKIESLLVSPSEKELLSGIVNWFTLPGQNPVKPPAKYKMTFISWLALYPTVTLVFFVFGDWLQQLPLLLRTCIVTAIVMLVMSYVLMPRFTRWFAFWLFPKHERNLR